MQYTLISFFFFFLVHLRACFIKDVFKLILKILHKNYRLFQHNFVKFLQQQFGVIAYIRHDLPGSTLADFFEILKNLQVNSGMLRRVFTKKLLEVPTNN